MRRNEQWKNRSNNRNGTRRLKKAIPREIPNHWKIKTNQNAIINAIEQQKKFLKWCTVWLWIGLWGSMAQHPIEMQENFKGPIALSSLVRMTLRRIQVLEVMLLFKWHPWPGACAPVCYTIAIPLIHHWAAHSGPFMTQDSCKEKDWAVNWVFLILHKSSSCSSPSIFLFVG